MFEKAVIRRAEHQDIDIGLIAETILFYGKTQLLLNRAVMDALTNIPRDDLLELSSRGCLNFSYVKPTFAVFSKGIIRTHSFVSFEVTPRQRKTVLTFQEEILGSFTNAYGNTSATRKAANKFIDRVDLFRHRGFGKKTNVICEETKADIGDPVFVRSSAAAILRNVAPAYQIPDRFIFEIINTDDGYAISTNLDFSTISKMALPPFTDAFTTAHMLGLIQDARADTFFAAHYMAELVTTSLSSELIRLKHYDWLQRADASRKEIALFSEYGCDNMPSIREVIISKERSIAEFLKLLDQAERFKSWLHGTNTDHGLVTAYINETMKDTWAEKLPYKLIKVFVLQAIGLAAGAAMPLGLAMLANSAASAGDPLLIERMIKGWKPAHFINGPYKKFVSVAL